MKSAVHKIFRCFLLVFAIACSNDDAPKIVDSSLTCFDGILNGDEIAIDCGGVCGGGFASCPLESIGILEGQVILDIQLDPTVEYRLTGPYLIRDGGSLAIPAGTVIKADPGIGAYIAVTQGGQLFVTGQPDNPVVITSGSDNPAPGDWGGIVVCGKAPINTTNIGRSDIIDIFYGGSDPNDTSGVFNYLRIEYAGAQVNDQKFAAIAFYGVGSITTITRLQSYESLGNGIRFIGGAVNTKWVAATNSGENGIAMANDWSGMGDFWHLSGNSKAGIKITSNSENLSEIAVDSISNISIIGPLVEGGIDYTSGNGKYTFANLYTSNLITGINVDNTVTSNIDIDNFKVESVEFDNQGPNFMSTNYMGSNLSFYSESANEGSGNRAIIPDWAVGWTRGID